MIKCLFQVLDADQAAFPDFLTSVLPCMDAGVESDNVALVQSPQVFTGALQSTDSLKKQRVWQAEPARHAQEVKGLQTAGPVSPSPFFELLQASWQARLRVLP